MDKNFDVIIIGAGPGGYIAAIRAAQLGLSVACIDEWKNKEGKPAPGGTCNNIGCIPSKALLQSSENFEQVNLHFGKHGISAGELRMDVAKMIERKNEVVKASNDGILYLFRKNKVNFFHGRAAFNRAVEGGFEVSVATAQPEILVGKQIIVATGSNVRPLPGLPFDEEVVLSNDGALDMAEVPKALAIIGAGVIGLELGSVWRRLGAAVTILEGLPTFLPMTDAAIAKEAKKAFDKQGLKIELGAKVREVEKAQAGVTIDYTDAQGQAQALQADKVIVAIGRMPNTEGLNPDAVGLELDERGAVLVDDQCRTSVPGIWAIGDVVRGPMLAHKAEEEGVAVVERIAGQHGRVDFNTIPNVIYTSPEIAWVGRTEQQLKESGIEYKVGTFPFLANGRARALGDTAGLAKVIADATTDEILGVHIVGPQASELVAEAVIAMEFKASSEDIARICFAHPTLSEALKEASLAVDKRALNF
ncbi:dihydrolipoyl dehydrogenase [Pseudomonas monteilii]|jgi:dihydrolipoamide dehydrogenase|uniref:dihydrolipoyl dehydrogenase n=1 Tax=Pseudomonadota TaxID=1224 RepID=UPI001E5BA994|nr:dihydrolipoyl dehydrogenase [Pseudomonas monteilii]MCE0872508.1 dihydrolipoyl dehydrogenase [Pseudomonas monteilii]